MALGPEELGSYLSSFMDNQVMGQMFMWLGYGVISALIIGSFVLVYFMTQYKYKVYYPKLHYSPDGAAAQIIGWKKDRARTIRRKDGRVQQHILFMNAKIEKFKEEDITPKNTVVVLKISKDSGTYIPMPTINFDGKISDFETLTPEEKHWAILQLKENANTYQDLDAQKRILTYTIIAVFIIMASLGFTAWLIMKQPARMAETANQMAQSLQGFAQTMGGGGPPPG